MNLDKYYKLKDTLETFSFEKNFKSLSNTLYYFSFLGNIFLVLLSFFFIKDITNAMPELFTFQHQFFSVFIILFMSGYELFKRFAFEQFTVSILRVRKFTTNIFIGGVVCIALILGSFYLALNGANRLVDNTVVIENVSESNERQEIDSVFNYYDAQIQIYQSQIKKLYENSTSGLLGPRGRETESKLQTEIKDLTKTRDQAIKKIEDKYSQKVQRDVGRTRQNDIAFIFITFSLEIIILIGVGFSSYYKWNSFTDMKRVLADPKYKKLDTNLMLLKLYYQNGKKKEKDPVVPTTRFRDLVSNSKIEATYKDVSEFVSLCEELEIISGKKKNKIINIPYEQAKEIMQSQSFN